MQGKPAAADKVAHLPNAFLATMQSETTYELVQGRDSDSCIVPVQLGRGRFAKVLRAWQRSAGRNVRKVAIKILHEHIDKHAETLFLQEIKLLKDLTAASSVNVINTLDILKLGPMAMCGGCGQIYHPRCPRCGEEYLQRHDPPGKPFPALRCGGCDYQISGEHIVNQVQDLVRPPAKTCCQKSRLPQAQRGTLLNFVDRDAVVMELVQTGLTGFHEQRARVYQVLMNRFGGAVPDSEAQLMNRVRLMEKVLLMVQLTEAVTWLHSQKRIIHKDLAPDNIMVCFSGDEEGEEQEWRGRHVGSFGAALWELACYQTFSTRVIDFGLSDQVELSRNWYEEPPNLLANEKLPYLSLESRHRRRRISQRIEFDVPNTRFLVPPSYTPSKAGELCIKAGDILADECDPQHRYYMKILEVAEDPPGSGVFYARYEGEPPPNHGDRHFDLVHPLGEAHDIYALGAIYYYVLTGEHTNVRKVTSMADVLQETAKELRIEDLQGMDIYRLCRDQMPEKFFQDELLLLLLRAMVRGKPQSLVATRTDRGPEPAQRLLHEIKQIYSRLKAEVLSLPVSTELSERLRRLSQEVEERGHAQQRTLLVTALAVGLLGLAGGGAFGFLGARHMAAERTGAGLSGR